MPYNSLLIVDDEPSNLAVLRRILSPDYRLMLTRDGAEALELATNQHPSLILLDIHMPGMSGYAVCRALKANPATETIPVIFVTTLSELTDEERGLRGRLCGLLDQAGPARHREGARAHPSVPDPCQATDEKPSRGDLHARQGRSLQ
jgi:putative two-component system response regulator